MLIYIHVGYFAHIYLFTDGGGDSEKSSDPYYGRCNIRDTKKIFDILGQKYAKVSLDGLPNSDYEKYRRKRLGVDLRRLHPPEKRTNYGSNSAGPKSSKSREATTHKSRIRYGSESPPRVVKAPHRRSSCQSKDGSEKSTRTTTKSATKSIGSPIVLLEAGAFSVGPYKG